MALGILLIDIFFIPYYNLQILGLMLNCIFIYLYHNILTYIVIILLTLNNTKWQDILYN
jgi:hypothetical protein